MNWYLDVLKKYVEFSGRARRKEYWMFFLFNFIAAAIACVIDVMIFGGVGVVYGLYILGVLLPSLGVTVRRLHDTGRTGWWVLAMLIPVIGFFVWIIFMVLDSQPGDNQYGSNPKGAAA